MEKRDLMDLFLIDVIEKCVIILIIVTMILVIRGI